MRNPKEMFMLFEQVVLNDERIRLSVLEGSLTNKHIPKDQYQDYDITFFVTEKDSFLKNDDWLSIFGKVIFMQKPGAMTLFPSEFPNMFSYLMYLEDGVKIDLSLILVSHRDSYFEESDGLVEVLVDKDQLVPNLSPATDEKYWLKKPTEAEFLDCLNEFWHVSAYIAKGIVRDELLFALDHLNQNTRQELLRMMSWSIGIESGFNKSLGKNYKFINQYLTEKEWLTFLKTFDLSTKERIERSFRLTMALFIDYSKQVSNRLGFDYPDDDEVMLEFIDRYYLKES